MRIGYLAMTPTRPQELREHGVWWHVRRVGTLLPARGVESWPERLWVLEPELFHPDLLNWKRRAKPLRAMVQAFAAGVPAEEAVLVESDLTAADVERFWTELCPMLAVDHARWEHLHARAAALRSHSGVEGLLRLERVLERFAWLLRQRTDPYRYDTAPHFPTMSNYRYHMIIHELVAAGRTSFLAALDDPELAVRHAEHSTPATQPWTLGLLRYDQVMIHVRVFRGSEMGLRDVEDGLPSFFEYYHFLRGIVPPDESFTPEFIKHPNGEFTIPGFYPPPPYTPPTKPARRAWCRASSWTPPDRGTRVVNQALLPRKRAFVGRPLVAIAHAARVART